MRSARRAAPIDRAQPAHPVAPNVVAVADVVVGANDRSLRRLLAQVVPKPKRHHGTGACRRTERVSRRACALWGPHMRHACPRERMRRYVSGCSARGINAWPELCCGPVRTQVFLPLPDAARYRVRPAPSRDVAAMGRCNNRGCNATSTLHHAQVTLQRSALLSTPPTRYSPHTSCPTILATCVQSSRRPLRPLAPPRVAYWMHSLRIQ